MKKVLPFALCSTAAALCLAAAHAQAGYVTPRVPPAAINLAAKPSGALPYAPNGTPTARIVTTVNDSGPGSLRDAIANAAPGDSITFALTLPATISLSNTLLIAADLTVLGPGPDKLTVMRSSAADTPSFRVFDVEAGVVAFSGMTIQNGSAYSGTYLHDNVGGAILNRGVLTVSNCVITGNSAPTTDWGTNVTPSVSLGFGAGIFSDTGSQLALFNSTVSGNLASAAGGAVCTLYADRFVAEGCTFGGNSADLQGGGLNLQGDVSTLQNCTLSGNATPPDGVGSAFLLIAFPEESATLTLTACTVAGNLGSASGTCALAALPGNAGVTNNLLSTLVADDAGPNFFLDGNPVLQSLSHNLDSDGTSGLVNGSNGDLVGTGASPIDPRLGPLQDNGGPTPTMALLPGSPAIGEGACTDASGAPLLVDQRGFPRPQSTGCDIGAYETQPLTLICPPNLVVEFMCDTGAVVTFSAVATSSCSNVTTVSTPPSGSLFPIGVTPVQVQAADGCGNTAQCGFTVTVLGAEGVKSNVLAELVALRASLKLGPPFAQKFDDAIGHLQNSLNPAYWIDQTHLQPKGGNVAMNEEKLAVNDLQIILGSRKCPVDPAILQGFINRIVKSDRLLAIVSIQDAAAAGLYPRKVAEDLATVARGDAQAAAGHYANAIEQYRNAWRHALQLRLKVCLNPDGSSQVQFIGNNSAPYLIEVSTDLVNWVLLGTCTADADGNVTFTDPTAVARSLGFYRVVEP